MLVLSWRDVPGAGFKDVSSALDDAVLEDATLDDAVLEDATLHDVIMDDATLDEAQQLNDLQGHPLESAQKLWPPIEHQSKHYPGGQSHHHCPADGKDSHRRMEEEAALSHCHSIDLQI